MNKTLNTEVNQNGIHEVVNSKNKIDSLIEEGNNLLPALANIYHEVTHANNMVTQAAENTEYAVQRYYNAEANRQMVMSNEIEKYNSLVLSQDNLLDRINTPEIRIWRYENQLYYRSNNDQLIIGNQVEIKKELSSRYGVNIHIVNDLNDVLYTNKIRVNTIAIAINNLPVVEEECFTLSTHYELFKAEQNFNNFLKRNLLANTRLFKQRLEASSKSITDTRKLMSVMTENQSDYISQWIGNIDIDMDTILLLVGNKFVSEDLIVQRVIEQLFNTNIVVTITEDMLKDKSLGEITKGKLFFHINQIPEAKENQEKLKELITSIIIQRLIQVNGYRIPTQGKIIVTIDEPHVFFKEFMEICTTLFIDTIDNIQAKLNVHSNISLYQGIENSLNSFSSEIASIKVNPLNLYKNDNQRYIESLSEEPMDTSFTSENYIPILNPFNDSFDTLIQGHNRIHILITGETGSGKTETVKTMIYSDIRRGDGSVIILDPHGDFAQDIIKLPIDKERIVFIDPALKDGVTPTYNIFESEKKLSEQEIKLQANIIIPVVKVINDEEKFSSAMEEMLYHCICVLLRKGDSSFKELLQFMNDKKNKKLIELGLESPNDLDSEYFEDDFPSAKQTRDALRRRLKKLLSDHYFFNLVNGKSTFDFEKLMNTRGKVIVLNVNKYNLPEHYGYFTRFILEMIQKIAFNRAKLPKEARIPTYCYIDECQNFITPKIVELLTEARKFKIHLNFSFPSIMQVKHATTRNIIASNTNIKLFGKDSNGIADVFKKVLNNQIVSEIPNFPVGQFYLKANNQDGLLIQNSDQLLDSKADISDLELKELKEYLVRNYRPIEDVVVTQPTEDEVSQMIQQFKNEVKLVLSFQKSIESSCLNNVSDTAPDRLEEIKYDIKYIDPNMNIERPRIRQQELSTIFQLSYELTEFMSNRKFIQILKVKDNEDMFNQTDSGTRFGDFTDDGNSQTQQYYYFEW